jgi:hypothetical protein
MADFSTIVSLYLPIEWLYLETDFSFKVPALLNGVIKSPIAYFHFFGANLPAKK